MNAKSLNKIAVMMSCLLAFGSAEAEVIGHALIPNTSDGKFISCRNPFQALGIVRAEDATVVYQARPNGVQWEFRLPPMISEYDQYYVAPDGSAAVIALSPQVGRVFLVSGNHKPITIHGAVTAVDFQKSRVLIATVDRENAPYRVRVYQRDSGALVGDTSFEAEFGDDFRRFLIRLAGDGQSYYYVAQTPAGGIMPVTRDVVTGQERVFDYEINGWIEDMLLYSDDRGYMVIDGRVFALGDRGLIPIPENDVVEPAYYLVESDDNSIQAVRGASGWGVFNTKSGNWVMAERQLASSLHSSGSILTVTSIHSNSGDVRTYDFSGLKPKLVRSISGSIVDKSLTCANAYGFMNYKDGHFVWYRSK